jgi:hypothetical protein
METKNTAKKDDTIRACFPCGHASHVIVWLWKNELVTLRKHMGTSRRTLRRIGTGKVFGRGGPAS